MSTITVDKAIELLARGELVAIPTETVYGLAGRIDREDTLKRIFEVKSRPSFDPLIVHVSDLAQARNLTTSWPEIFDLLAKEFWPGPLTLIAPKTAAVSSLITAGLDSVGLRSPSHPVAREILQKVGVPLAAPSANRFGKTSPTKAEHVVSEFSGRVPVVDGGACDVGVESTVLAAQFENGKWNVQILRPGGISQKQISDTLNKNKISFSIGRAHSVASPGHSKAHYQPDSPLVIVQRKVSDQEIKKSLSDQDHEISEVRWLELPEDPIQAARVLYQKFRDLSTKGSAIAIEKKPIHAGEDWHGVWDRVERAAILHI